MPRNKKQFEEIRQAKINLIMNTALELFANEGYFTTSISKIAKKAGISKGLMYNYFESKEALLIRIMSVGLEEVLNTFDSNHDGVLSEEEMVDFIHKAFNMLEENTQHWKLYFAVLLQPQVLKLLSNKLHEVYSKVYGMLTYYYKSHKVDNPEQEALLFGALLDGIAFNYVLNPEVISIEKIKKIIIQKFCYLNK